MKEALVKHVRDDFGVPHATLAMVDENAAGLAICGPRDQFNKALGREIAIGRAETGGICDCPSNRYILRGDEYVPLFTIVQEEAIRLRDRARLYFRAGEKAVPIFMRPAH